MAESSSSFALSLSRIRSFVSGEQGGFAIATTPLNATIAGTAFLLAAGMYSLGNQIRATIVKKRWKKICLQVLRERDGRRHRFLEREELGTLKELRAKEEEDTRIARLRGTELVSAMREGSLSSERIVSAFSRRARSIGHAKTRAVTEEFYDEAIATAALVDQERQNRGGKHGGSSGSTMGISDNSSSTNSVGIARGDRVLEGIPISTKDTLHMKGALTTCGMASNAALGPSEEDGLIVKVMRAHGAIPFVRGNVPQCLMLPESDNAIFGRSDNPWKLDRTPGGSSGGEGSLVASRSSPIAIGSDVGGSIRIPCHFTGTCGLKPTPERMTKKGMGILSEDGKVGQRIIHVTVGPIANSVRDLELVMTALCSPAMWEGDISVPRLPWDRAAVVDGPGRPLKIGYFTTDHWFEPCASVTRAVHEAAEGLREAGHVVVPFEPPVSGWEIARMYYGQMGAEGNMQRFVDALQGEEMLSSYESLRKITCLSNVLRPFLSWVLRVFVGDYRKASLLGVTKNKGLSVRQYYKLVGDTYDLRSKWETSFVEAGLDAVIFPPAALAALPHGYSKDLTPAFTYMFLANLLHWPAGVVPVTVVRPDEEDYNIESLPIKQRDVTARFARAAVQGSAGLPIGVQVMTAPFKDEMALHVMQEVERAVEFDAVPDAAGF